MDIQGPNQAKVSAALVAAARAARGCDPLDTQRVLQVLMHLKELEIHLEHSSRGDLVPLCEMAMEIAERIVRKVDPEPEDPVAWVERLLEFLSAALGVSLESEASEPTPAHEPLRMLESTEPRRRLSIADGNRLGELLIRMSHLGA